MAAGRQGFGIDRGEWIRPDPPPPRAGRAVCVATHELRNPRLGGSRWGAARREPRTRASGEAGGADGAPGVKPASPTGPTGPWWPTHVQVGKHSAECTVRLAVCLSVRHPATPSLRRSRRRDIPVRYRARRASPATSAGLGRMTLTAPSAPSPCLRPSPSLLSRTQHSHARRSFSIEPSIGGRFCWHCE